MIVDTERAVDVDDCMDRMLERDDDYRYSVAWIDCLANGAHLGRSVLTRGNHAALDDLPSRQAIRCAPPSRRVPLLRTPPWIPNGLLNPLSIRAFNELWFRKAPRERRDQVQSITAFFHPLDVGARLEPDLRIEGLRAVPVRRAVRRRKHVVRIGARTTERAPVRVVPRGPEALRARQPRSARVPDRGLDTRARRARGRRESWTCSTASTSSSSNAGGRVYLTKDSRLRADLAARDVPAARPLARGAFDARPAPPPLQRHGSHDST